SDLHCQRGVDEQQPAERKTEDADQTAVGIVRSICHELVRERLWDEALTHQPIVKSTNARDRKFTARQACADTLGHGCLKDHYWAGRAIFGGNWWDAKRRFAVASCRRY